MKPALNSTHLSIALGLVFAAWIVWLWVDDGQKTEVVKPEMTKVEEQVEEVREAQPTAFILPAPPMAVAVPAPAPTPAPAPAPASAPVVEPIADVVVEIPIEKPSEPEVQQEPAPAPVAEVKPAPIEKVAPIVEVKTELKVDVKPEQKAEIHRVNQAETVGGRALLRVLEHGKGPQIEIAWPKDARARDQLYRKFQTCFSMVNALMDGEGNLFRNEEPRGTRWEINMDRFSGFLRQADGVLPSAEQRIMRSISQRHKNISRPLPVRIFPRAVDASLLGGLQSLVGAGYMNAKSIQARYDLDGSHVLVRDIQVDGQSVSGIVELSKTNRCGGNV